MKKEKLNILVLYCLGDFKKVKDNVKKFLFFLKKYKPEHNYLFHNIYYPYPDYLMDINFDAVIFDNTFFWVRHPRNEESIEFFNYIKNEYSFLRDINSLKIAFPQDDFDCSEILDEWLCELKVDYVFSPLGDNKDIDKIYKNYIKIGKIKLSYVVYIDDDYFKLLEYARNFDDREIDIGYRTHKFYPIFGWIGELKWKIADIVKDKAKKYDLVTDISYDLKDIIYGEEWYKFLSRCKFSLGSLSGSSLIDPKGEIYKKVVEYCEKNPDYNYDDINKLFYNGEDKYFFTAISPRNIESIFTKTCQILVEGPYSDILLPWEHYIPLKKDASNFYEVYNAMKDKDLVNKIINNSLECIINKKELYFSKLADDIIKLILDNKKIIYNDLKSEKLIKKYNEEYLTKIYRFNEISKKYEKIKKIISKNRIFYNFAKKIYNYLKKFLIR